MYPIQVFNQTSKNLLVCVWENYEENKKKHTQRISSIFPVEDKE